MMADASSKGALKRWQNPEYLQMQINAQTKRWEDPKYVAKLMKSLCRRPNKPEKRLMGVFAKRLPDFKYNGDCSLGVVLGGMVPDFVNTNGKKQVIEFLGDYWHSPEVIGDRTKGSAEGKAAIYGSLGWDCLCIWEHDANVMSDDQIVSKVEVFFSRGKE